jgi:hypothetical protein
MKPHCDVAEGPTWHSPRSGLVQPNAGPNDEEHDVLHVPLRASLARSPSSVSFSLGQ